VLNIASGDMVVCSILENTSEMIENKVYVVVSNQSVWVKRVQRFYGWYNRWTHSKLILENHGEHDTFVIEISEVRELLKVKRRLTELM